MKIYLCLIGFAMSHLAFSQKEISIKLQLTPLYGYRAIDSTNPFWNNIIVNDLNTIEQPDYGLSFGFLAERKIAKKFTLGVGIEKTDMHEKITRSGSTISNGQLITLRNDYYNTYEYIGFSLATRYNLVSTSHWEIGLVLSARLDRLMQYEIEPYSTRNDNSLSVWIYNKYSFGSSFGINFEYEIKRTSFYVNPGYFRYLTPNAQYNYTDNTNFFTPPVSTEIRQHNYYFFASFGIRYSLNNH